MRHVMIVFMCYILFAVSFNVYAKPHWDREKVPNENSYQGGKLALPNVDHLKTVTSDDAIDVLRIQVEWQEVNELYHVSKMVVEPSGTPALLMRSKKKPQWGSYLGVMKSNKTGDILYYDAIGTGKQYRKLARAINLRFPLPLEDMTFELFAENPQSGVMEKVISYQIVVNQLKREDKKFDDLEIKELVIAKELPAIRINIYAEGYGKNEKELFWKQALKTVQVLQREKFPGIERMSFYAVFHPSNKKLGSPKNLGLPVPEYDTFLGLYYPYWNSVGRWYHIVYPTREDKFRQNLASAPYDYPLVLINHDGYWGVGNYLSLTAIPAGNTYNFTYLLMHEFGHFFGLNEEYEGGGPTELEFAPDIAEPWSQNITFLREANHESLKWNEFVNSHTKLPTPVSQWKPSPPVYGAYRGGYGDSPSTNSHSHKPGLACIMESHSNFCDICSQGIRRVIQYSLGEQVVTIGYGHA